MGGRAPHPRGLHRRHRPGGPRHRCHGRLPRLAQHVQPALRRVPGDRLGRPVGPRSPRYRPARTPRPGRPEGREHRTSGRRPRPGGLRVPGPPSGRGRSRPEPGPLPPDREHHGADRRVLGCTAQLHLRLRRRHPAGGDHGVRAGAHVHGQGRLRDPGHGDRLTRSPNFGQRSRVRGRLPGQDQRPRSGPADRGPGRRRPRAESRTHLRHLRQYLPVEDHEVHARPRGRDAYREQHLRGLRPRLRRTGHLHRHPDRDGPGRADGERHGGRHRRVHPGGLRARPAEAPAGHPGAHDGPSVAAGPR